MPKSSTTKHAALSKERHLAIALTDWFSHAARALPWREHSSPYGTWVSEIMLQQTRVATVIPYWQRWMNSFPSVQALAAADADQVLSHWAGLGYYSRARNLHAGAKYVAGQLNGELPTRAAELTSIPGIGPYTAGAIASIAYAQRTPLVDGNVARVVARIYGIESSIKDAAVQRQLWQHASQLMDALPDATHPGALNQSLMELGALVCVPSSPRCHACPVVESALCRAHAMNAQDRIPLMPVRKKQHELPLLKVNALWVCDGNQVLLARRKPKALFGGLWELPGDEDLNRAAGWSRVDSVNERPVAHLRQILTHRRLDIAVFTAQISSASLGKRVDSSYAVAHDVEETCPYDQWRMVNISQVCEMGIAAATAAIIDKFLDSPWKTIPKHSLSSIKATKKSSKVSASSATISKIPTLPTPQRGRPKGSTSSSTIKRKSKAK
jgi:A/G-specific adenine glycosylase